ncbi:MAG: hypothetical protein F6K42_29920 [Leptolyngbya sp. SIO1D8]|nr:hypothetical protein [Leptolyngbya sp. SIO1D8]
MFSTTAQTKQQPPTLVALASSVKSSDPAELPADAITFDYLAIVFETFLDHVFPSQGFMLLDHQGNVVQSNGKARQICRVLLADAAPLTGPDFRAKFAALPAEIKTLISAAIESCKLFPHLKFQLEDTVVLQDKTRIRLQVEWIHLDDQAASGIVVTLEDLTEAAHQRALLEANRYNLTDRETQVWELTLQRLSYRQIGEELFISVNTVKRHIKNIHMKQRRDRDE